MHSDSSPSTSESVRGRWPSHVAGLLANLPFVGWIIAIAYLIGAPYRKDTFVRFYALQSIFLVVGWVVLYVVFAVIFGELFRVFIRLDFVANFLFPPVFFLGALAVRLFLMYMAYHHEKIKLPIIGTLAAKRAE
jgi:uncharacterized membrane protein